MKTMVLAALALTISQVTQAADFSLNSGFYGQSKNYYSSPGDYRLQKEGSKLRVVDVTNNLTYEIDTANPAEQLLQPKLLEHLRAQPGSRTIAGIVDHITVSNLSVDDQGILRGIFNIYIVSKSMFGSLRSKLSIGAQVQNTPCMITRHNGFDPKTYQELTSIYTGSCINAELGTTFGVQSLEALNPVGGKAFAKDITNAIGLTTDTIFKFYSPVMTGLISLYEQR